MARPGVVAAWGACIASIGYGIPQLLQVAHLLPDPLDRVLIFASSLALAPLFVLALAGAYVHSHHHDRPWRMAALAMALLYAGSVSKVYAIQLGVVIPRELDAMAAIRDTACCGFRQPLTAVDLLGYTWMSAACALLAPSFAGRTRWALAANGVLGIPIFLQLWWPALIWVASPWLVLFPLAMAWMAIALSPRHAHVHPPRQLGA